MKTLKIEIPEGFKVDSFDDKTGELKFIPIPKTVIERIKTFDDVLNETGFDKEEFKQSLKGLDKDEKAYRKLKLLAAALNEDWVPDWNNSSEYKYYPWFRMGSASGGFSYGDFDFWHSRSSVGSRLCFKSRELAEYAGKQFETIYKDFLTL
ncbi:hypothetical protein ETU09_00615 [Apibacter muscae]|uniref:Uncharacterized protein n=1 Tax=Apibacter muscae TaxID=2509004 RepID=A0A563DJX8_9FLAO|nr:hypothetical protein [Apibacter muscae]TWP30536.1 hypothetical protein ETU09_00615 [Apibacter muscae]